LLRHSSPITDREPAGSQQVPGSLPMDDKGELERILAHLEDENRLGTTTSRGLSLRRGLGETQLGPKCGGPVWRVSPKAFGEH